MTMSQNGIDPRTSLGDLVLDEPRRAGLFERLGFDFCCRGGRSLAETCAQHGLDVDTVVRLLGAGVGDAAPAAAPACDLDWRRASIAELCDHVVAVHHEPLRQELPRLHGVFETVVRVHGSEDARLGEAARVFGTLALELEWHMSREERELFPACRAVADGAPADHDALLAELGHDHTDVGETLVVLRDLADGYRADAARCSTHRSLLTGLHALEQELHRHIHEENNVLFPRVRDRLDDAA